MNMDTILNAEAPAAEPQAPPMHTDVPTPEMPPPPRPARVPAERQAGVSAFPAARVAKIIKADADVDMCSKEAVFAISMATVRRH